MTEKDKKESKGAKTLRIVQGIAQACTRTQDGAFDEDYKKVEIGLRREKPVSYNERRFIDGFKVNFTGYRMHLTYQSEIHLKEVYEKDFEGYINDIIGDIISYIKSQYKKITKETLSLKMVGEPHLQVQRMNRMRCWVVASCSYDIGGIDKEEELPNNWQERMDDKMKKWLGVEKK